MRFSLKRARKFGWKGLKGWVFNSKTDFKNASAAYFEVTGRHGKIKTKKSDRIYFVIDGHGEFSVGKKVFRVKKNDVVIVPKNTPYDYRTLNGKLKLFLVHTPAFDPKAEVNLEK